ncbi:MAG: 7-carboxy-7-deazaguanine synthase QueE [Planctomycetota bacterium]|nr:7-carboxy-7-deazaguanine synthase QueE [Planctomycetota bacterium]
MRIAELYKSIQGEGRHTGVESIFVRTSGCNLRCGFCDTPYTSWQPEGDDRSVDEIMQQVVELQCTHVVLTGGEPMLHAELVPLTQRLRAIGSYITIETAGTLFLPVECDLLSISPKLANSRPPLAVGARWQQRHERDRHAPDVIRALISAHDYQFKFVVDSLNDCAEVEDYLREFNEIKCENVLLMPQGIDPETLARHETWLPQYCQQHDLTYCPRKQIEWFGYTRGT